MPSLILLMIAGAAVVAWWNASRAAAERAEVLGRDACAAADVQWLDQSVHANGLRLYRREDGWLGLGPEIGAHPLVDECRTPAEEVLA